MSASGKDPVFQTTSHVSKKTIEITWWHISLVTFSFRDLVLAKVLDKPTKP